MASLRFSRTNRLETATLKNGTGAPAPVRDETPAWVTELVQDRDRGLVWQSAGGAFIDLDFDLTGAASNVSIAVLAALGHRGAPSSAIGALQIIPQYSTHANGYPPVSGNPWTAFPGGTLTLGFGIRDAGKVVTPAACRYVRYSFTAATMFTLGRLWAGAVDTDLGVKYSPGRNRRRMDPESRLADAGGNPSITYTGDPRYVWRLPYDSADATLFALVETIGKQRGSYVLIEPSGSTVFEVIRATDSFEDRHNFDVPDDYDTALDLESLG